MELLKLFSTEELNLWKASGESTEVLLDILSKKGLVQQRINTDGEPEYKMSTRGELLSPPTGQTNDIRIPTALPGACLEKSSLNH
jgi:hypothetical protein